MKHVVAFGFLVLSVAACTPETSVSRTANSTSAFDGYYEKPVITSKSQGCPDLGSLPYVRISNGLATLQAPTFNFQVLVTPEGMLSMQSTQGQTFQGQIDPHFVLNANISGPNCSYHIVWTDRVDHRIGSSPDASLPHNTLVLGRG